MEFAACVGDIDSDTIDDNRGLLSCFSFLALVASGLHCHTTNYTNSAVDVIFTTFMVIFLARPTWITLTAMMTFSLTQCCASILLLGAKLMYENNTLPLEIFKNTRILAHTLDVVYSLVIFFMLNTAWETPTREYNMEDERALCPGNEQEDVWAPFAGTGKAIAEYQLDGPDLEKNDNGIQQ